MTIFIGGAWPYANGSLHLGHLVSLLPGDVLARYFRLKGEDVLYVSGSDCNGTPITIRAREEDVSPKEIADRYHQEFEQCFKQLGFTYDWYTRTDSHNHHKVVQELFLKLVDHGFIYSKEVEQTFCETCQQFLPDRYVEGDCPNCGKPARGDQCDYCSALLNPVDLVRRKCKLCGSEPVTKPAEHLYFSLSKFQEGIQALLDNARKAGQWRVNAIGLTERYLNEGLVDRAVTRDLPIGVSVPVQGFEDKKIYVWIEAVSGYYSASREWAEKNGTDWGKFWSDDAIAYYVHGKDNIPFHTIIWPAILKGVGGLKTPDRIISSEYLTLEKRKLSTSRNWAVWVPDILKNYHPDSIRYFLIMNGAETRDADFSWQEFILSHNSELLGAYGNFVNRTLKFVGKSFAGIVPDGSLDAKIRVQLSTLYETTGEKIADGHFKNALETIFAFIRSANKYFDEKQPWKTINDDQQDCQNTLYTCVQMIANLTNLLDPFIPFSSAKVRHMLGLVTNVWDVVAVKPGTQLPTIKPLFTRIDVQQIEAEREKLGT
jgi:methionyl-tRNA synthetase